MHKFKKWDGVNRVDENRKCCLAVEQRQALSRNMMLHCGD
jgi:hypothetical protein